MVVSTFVFLWRHFVIAFIINNWFIIIIIVIIIIVVVVKGFVFNSYNVIIFK